MTLVLEYWERLFSLSSHAVADKTTISVRDTDTLVDDHISIFFVNYGISVSVSTAVRLSF